MLHLDHYQNYFVAQRFVHEFLDHVQFEFQRAYQNDLTVEDVIHLPQDYLNLLKQIEQDDELKFLHVPRYSNQKQQNLIRYQLSDHLINLLHLHTKYHG
eukprot:Transcript_21624.p5 GENE.Transcript_21624~~Transcript_21624.p5  ORF type:complete len:99 (+),score=14.72 Transcript_21624:5420-5716(+)